MKEYIDRAMKVVNQIRLLGEDLPERRVVEKVMVTLLERFEAQILHLKMFGIFLSLLSLSLCVLYKLLNKGRHLEKKKGQVKMHFLHLKRQKCILMMQRKVLT